MKAIVDLRQAGGHGVTRGKANGAAVDALQAIVGEQVYDAIAGVLGSAVDSKDAHFLGFRFAAFGSRYSEPGAPLIFADHEGERKPRAG